MQDILDPKYLATLSDEQFDALLNSVAQPQKPKPKPYVEPTPPRDMGFMEGNLKKAWGGFGTMAGGALGLVGDLVGSDTIKEYGLGAVEGAQMYNRDIDQRMITPETNLVDTYEKQGLWEAAKATPQFIAEQAVQNLPMMVGTGGVGGLVGKSATKSLLLKELSKKGLAAEAIKEGVEATARKHLGDDVLTAIANKGGLAATGASGAQWSGLESGSIYADQPIDQKDPLKALAFGTAAGMIEPLPEAAAIMRSGLGKKLLTGVGKEGAETYKQAFKNVGVDLLKQAPLEGAQEMVQTGLEQAGAHKDPFTEESFKEQVVGGIAGMGIGGAFGGATSTYQNFPLKKKIVDNKTEVDLTGNPSDLKEEAMGEEIGNTILNNTPPAAPLNESLSANPKPVKNIFKQVSPIEEDGYAESFEKMLPQEDFASVLSKIPASLFEDVDNANSRAGYKTLKPFISEEQENRLIQMIDAGDPNAEAVWDFLRKPDDESRRYASNDPWFQNIVKKYDAYKQSYDAVTEHNRMLRQKQDQADAYEWDNVGRFEISHEDLNEGMSKEDLLAIKQAEYREALANGEIDLKAPKPSWLKNSGAYEKYMPVVEDEQKAPINVYYGTGENAHFSNLAHRPFELGGKKYVSVEHAYQSNKSGAFDQETYDKYKKAGVKIAGNKGTDTKTNMDIMAKAMYQSFKQNPEAARKLIETGDAEFSHKQDKTIWKEAFPKLLKDVRDALVYEQQYGNETIAPEQPKQAPRKLEMQPDNIEKIKSGAKTATTRTYPIKAGEYSLPDGTKVIVENDTKPVWFKDLKDQEAYARAEGFESVADMRKNAKFPTTKQFIDGKIQLHIAKFKLAEIKPSVGTKTIFPKKDTVSSDLEVESGSKVPQSIIPPTSGAKNVFSKVAQTEGVEVGAKLVTKSRFQNEPHKINYYKKIFKTAEIPYDDKNKEAVAIESGYDSFQEMFETEGTPANDALKKVKFNLKAEQASKRLGTKTTQKDIAKFLDKNKLLTDDAKKALAEREITSLKRTGNTEDITTREYQQFQRKVHSPNFTSSKPSYDRDNPKLRGVHKQKDFSEEKEGLIKELTTNKRELAKRLSLRVRRDKATDIKGLEAIITRKITADNNKAMLDAKSKLAENKLLSPEEKKEILDYIKQKAEEDIFIPDLIEELNRTGEVYSFVYLDAVPDMIANTDPDDLDNSWGKKGGQQKIEDNLDGTFSRNEDYVVEKPTGKLKVKPTHRYKLVRKGNGKVGIESKPLEARLQDEKERQDKEYQTYINYKIDEVKTDIENVALVIDAIKDIADEGKRSVDNPLTAELIYKRKAKTLAGKDEKARIESVRRIMSNNRIIVAGEWVPKYNSSNEWVGVDELGNEEEKSMYFTKEKPNSREIEESHKIHTEYVISELIETLREINPTAYTSDYAAEIIMVDDHDMIRKGFQLIETGVEKADGFAPREIQVAKSYVVKSAIDNILDYGLKRGFANEGQKKQIEKLNDQVVALQKERDELRDEEGTPDEDGRLWLSEPKEKYYLAELATLNRKMMGVLKPVKAAILKAQLKSVFFEDKNFFEKESDKYVSQGFTKEFLHALAKESQYDRTIYESRVNREVQRKNQELADEIFKEVKAGDKDVSAINSYLFSAGNFTQQERENFAKYDDSIKVKNVDGNTDIVRFIDTLTTQEREKLEIFKALQQRLLDVVKTPKAGLQVKDQDAHVKEYMKYSHENRAEILFADKEESEKTELEKSVEQFFATRHPDEKVSLGKLRDQSQQTFFEKFAKTFGAELVVIRDYRERHKQFQGKYFVSKSGKPVIIINANGTSFGRVFAHELFHHIVNKANPKEYAAFKDAVLTNVSEKKLDEAIEKARAIWSPYMTKAEAVRTINKSEFNTSPKRIVSSDNQSTIRRTELGKNVTDVAARRDDISSNWSSESYETGLKTDFQEGLKAQLEEEIFAEMFSFAFNTKDFWENMSNTPAGVSLAQRLIKGFLDVINKALAFFNKNIKQLDNGIFGIKGLVAHDNWFDDIITGEAPPEGKTFTDVYGKMPVSGAFSLMYDLMGAALDSNTLNSTVRPSAEQSDNGKLLPTIEEVKNHIANHDTYKKIFPNGINSYKDVMTAIENLLSNLKTWIVKNMPAGVFTHVGASEPVKKIMFSVAHGGMLEAQKAFGDAVEPHAKVFDKMTSLELEAFVDDVTKNGLKNVTQEQKAALLAMQKVADQTFAKLQRYFPYLQQRENHFGLSIKWLNKDRTLFEDEFEWEAYGSKLEGNKRFMKEKSDLSIAEIREKYNLDYETIHPQKLFLRYIKDAHYLMNFQEQMKDARKEDIARYFTDQKEAMEAGYVPVNDNALKVFQRMGFSDGYKIKLSDGTYYSQNETPVYFSSEYEANKVAEAISGAYESVEVEKFTPDKLAKVAYFDIYTEVDGKELFVSSAKTQKEAERIAKKNPDYFIKERIASQGDSVVAQMYFKPDMAKMMNSLLSYDGFKNFKAFGVSGVQAMDLKNIATSIELSFSMFHAFTIGQESISSYAAWQQGLKKLGIGSGVGVNSYNPVKVVAESKKIVTLMKNALKQGNTKEILARAETLLGIKSPDVLDIMTQYYHAGGMLGQDSDLRGSGADVGHVDYSSSGSFFNSFKETYNKEVNEFKQKNPDSKIKFGASISWDMFKYTAHASSAWLMEEGIPKIKMAQFAREYSLKLEQYKEEIAAGLITKEQIAIDTILFIEDRFGEVSWKNKWLDATYKTSLQFAFRSFTWIAGTYVALGKVMPEYAKLGWFKLKGEEYHLTEKGLWGIHVLGAHIFTAALLSSVYTLGAALSGDEQETDKDTPWLTRMLFPRVDPYDNTRRLSVPSYVTEFYKIATHLGYGGNPIEVTKLISGRFNSLLSKSVELAKNEDFRGTLIRNPKDSIVGQTADVIQHIIPLPISWSTIIKDAQKEGFKPQSVMTGLMGFTDAPASAKRSVAANTAYKIGRKEYKGKETTEDQMELKDELSRAMSAYKSGNKSKVEKLLAEGRISTRQFQIALERTPIIKGKANPAYKDQLEQQVSRLTIDGSLDVWEKMTKNEQNKTRAAIIKKYSNMLSHQDKPREEKKKITARMKELGIIK